MRATIAAIVQNCFRADTLQRDVAVRYRWLYFHAGFPRCTRMVAVAVSGRRRSILKQCCTNDRTTYNYAISDFSIAETASAADNSFFTSPPRFGSFLATNRLKQQYR